MIKIATKGEKGSAIVASTTKAVTKLAEKGKQLTTKVAAKAKEFKKQVNTAIAQAKQNGRKQLDHLQSALQGNRQNDFALAGGGKLVTQTTRKEKPTDTLVQASSGKGSSSTKGTGNLSYTQKVDKYQERTQAIRDNLPSKYKKYGNVAVADVNISGLKSEFKAHSRIHKEYEGGFSYVIGEGKFPAKSVNHKGETDAPNAFLRANDTERKILEDISRQLGDDKPVKGTIDLFTELPACGSCTDIILQFRKEYPNIKLNVYSGEFKD